MKNQERNIKDVLEKKVKISDEVEERLESTYEILRNRSKVRIRKQHKFPKVAAAVIVTALMVSTGVYASIRSDFFDGMFGNTTKKSTPAKPMYWKSLL